MKVLVDETSYAIDSNHSVFIVVHVLATDKAVDDFLFWYNTVFLPDNLRYKNKRKVHYTDEDESIKELFVDVIKDLEITAKVYVWRAIDAYNMADVVRWSLNYQQETNGESEFIIEQSGNAYDTLVAKNVDVVSGVDAPQLAIADIFAGVYLGKAFTRINESSAARRYTLLRPRLRLVVERDFDGTISKRTRAQILR